MNNSSLILFFLNFSISDSSMCCYWPTCFNTFKTSCWIRSRYCCWNFSKTRCAFRIWWSTCRVCSISIWSLNYNQVKFPHKTWIIIKLVLGKSLVTFRLQNLKSLKFSLYFKLIFFSILASLHASRVLFVSFPVVWSV